MSAPLPGVARLLGIIAALREEGGCPWDREQTLESLKPYLVEETYELIDAVDSGDTVAHKEELGDVLLQVAMQARIREEEGAFAFDDIAGSLADKLVRRHPHVFGDVRVDGSQDVLRRWDAIKADEKGGDRSRSIAEGIPRRLPALQKAQRIQSRAARVGFDWDKVEDVLAKLDEETAELRAELNAGDRARLDEELGDLLFSVVNLCRHCGVIPEDALNRAVEKFVRRFSDVERHIRDAGRELSDCTLEELDACWDAVKRAEGKCTEGHCRP